MNLLQSCPTLSFSDFAKLVEASQQPDCPLTRCPRTRTPELLADQYGNGGRQRFALPTGAKRRQHTDHEASVVLEDYELYALAHASDPDGTPSWGSGSPVRSLSSGSLSESSCSIHLYRRSPCEPESGLPNKELEEVRAMLPISLVHHSPSDINLHHLDVDIDSLHHTSPPFLHHSGPPCAVPEQSGADMYAQAPQLNPRLPPLRSRLEPERRQSDGSHGSTRSDSPTAVGSYDGSTTKKCAYPPGSTHYGRGYGYGYTYPYGYSPTTGTHEIYGDMDDDDESTKDGVVWFGRREPLHDERFDMFWKLAAERTVVQQSQATSRQGQLKPPQVHVRPPSAGPGKLGERWDRKTPSAPAPASSKSKGSSGSGSDSRSNRSGIATGTPRSKASSMSEACEPPVRPRPRKAQSSDGQNMQPVPRVGWFKRLLKRSESVQVAVDRTRRHSEPANRKTQAGDHETLTTTTHPTPSPQLLSPEDNVPSSKNELERKFRSVHAAGARDAKDRHVEKEAAIGGLRRATSLAVNPSQRPKRSIVGSLRRSSKDH